jgi:mRNA interferase YafQ
MTIRRLFTTSAFERDLRRMKRQRKDLARIEVIVEVLRANEILPPRCRVHPLRGEWKGHWDCHIEPDWVLIYKIVPGALILVRTGSHSELFR